MTTIRVLVAGGLLALGSCQPGETPPAESAPPKPAELPATAHYLANAGVLIEDGDTTIAFDPLFRNDYGRYQLLPETLERALFAGEPPFDGLDAVFVSHYHEDHFSAVDLLRLLLELPNVELYAPAQAVAQMRDVANETHREVFERVTEITLEYKDSPILIEAGELIVEAVRIPHSGWPERAEISNIVFRVTLAGGTTVLHMGDADTNVVHFEDDADYWARRDTHMAFPPYWYFPSEDGRRVLDEWVKPARAVGMHVPVDVPDDPALKDADLFTEPGETREIPR